MKVSSPLAMIRNRLQRERIYCTAEYWDAKATEHEGDAASMWPNNNLNALYYEEIAETYASKLPGFSGLEVLEVGCGTGRNTKFLADRGAKVTGVDFSEKAVARARERFEGEPPFFRVQSVFAIDDDGRFDLVVSWGTLTIACRERAQLEDVMRRLRRALKPGGRVLLLEPIHKGPLHRVLKMREREFLEVMRGAGFRIDDVHHMHFWPARLALAFVPWPESVTRPVYFGGQWIMKHVLRQRRGGDYQAILATNPA